jgi:hypothetical protein
MLLIEKLENIDQIEADWDRTDWGDCDPCWISVDEYGVYQCRDCLCLYLNDAIRCKGGVIECLKRQYLDAWKEEYKKLKEVRRLVLRGEYEKLHLIHYTYRDSNGKIVNERSFYEKRQ